MNAKDSSLQVSVSCLATSAAAAPVSKGVGVEGFAPSVHGFLGWLDNWFSTSSEERMRDIYMAYWS